MEHKLRKSISEETLPWPFSSNTRENGKARFTMLLQNAP